MRFRLINKARVISVTARSKSSIHDRISKGLFVPPIRPGERPARFPESEVEAIVEAEIAGENDESIRALVSSLVAQRARV